MANPTEKRYDLFVSYAEDSDEREWAERHVVDALKAQDFHIHSEAMFRLGVPRLEEFEQAITQSKRVLLVLSPAFFADEFDSFVDLLAQSYGDETGTWPVIPLILHPISLPTRLRMLTHLDATDPEAWDEVIDRLCKELGRPVPGPTPIPPCPYPGMKPFTEADQQHFFGREQEVQELAQRLHKRPFAAVIGPSGSGKSSLVFAGLLPALRRSSLSGHADWEVRAMRPGQRPSATLQTTLADVVELTTATLRSGADPVADKQLLLIIDQFEECFTLAEETEATSFQETLLRLIQVETLPIVLTARADFYADFMNSPLWPEIQGRRLEIAPLDEEDLHQAIQLPAESVGVYIQTALVERLLADAAHEPGVLPFVQETMQLLWQKVERRFLPLEAYETLVLPRAAYGGPERSGLQVAIALHADATLGDLKDEQERQIAKRIFLRLIQFGEGRSDTRRQQPESSLRATGDDPAQFEHVLLHLAANRLLTVSGGEVGERQVDISHEALINGWDTLSDWVHQRRDAEQVRRRLEGKAAEWQRLGSGHAGLLDEVELHEAERWSAADDARELGWSNALSDLVTQSRRSLVEQARRQQREAYFRYGAAAALVVLALFAALIYQSSQTAAAERQVERQQQAAEATAAFADQEAAAAATIAVRATDEAYARATAVAAEAIARQQLAIAQSRQVAAIANGRLQEDPQQALLFGIAALDLIADTVEAESAVRAALGEWRNEYQFQAHERRTPGIVYSPHGQLLATFSEDNTAKLWQLDPDGQLPLPEQDPLILTHDGSISGLVFGPNNERVATSSRDRNLRIWEVATGKLLFTLPHEHPEGIRGLLLSPDQDTLITRSGVNLGFYSLRTGTHWKTFQATSNLRTLNFMFGGQLIVTGADDNTIWLWHEPTGRHIQLPGFDHWVEAVQVSGDDHFLAARTRSGTLYVLKAPALQTPSDFDSLFAPPAEIGDESGERTVSSNRAEFTLLFSRPNDAAWTNAFSPDSQHLAVGGTDGSIRLWLLHDLEAPPKTLLGHTQRVEELTFSADGQLLASTSLDGTTRLWRTARGEEVARLRTTPYYGRGVRFTPNGRLLVNSDERGILYFWRALAGSDIGFNLTALTPPRSLVLLADRAGPTSLVSQVATVGEDGQIDLWQPQTGETTLLRAGQQRLEAIAAAGDGTVLAVGAVAGMKQEKGAITLLNRVTGEVQRAWPAHRNGVYALAFLPDGETLASAGGDAMIRIWRLSNGELLRTLEGHQTDVHALAVSPDGQWLYSAGIDGTVRQWDWRTGIEADQWNADTALLTLAVSPAGHFLAAGGYPPGVGSNQQDNAVVTVWDLRTGQRYLLNHGLEPIHALAFSHDGRLISGDESGRIRLWRIAEKQAVQIAAHNGWVSDLVVSPDGRFLFSVGTDAYVRGWPLEHNAVLALACQRAQRVLTQFEWETYVAFPVPIDQLCDPRTAAETAAGTFSSTISRGVPQAKPGEQALPTILYFEPTSGTMNGNRQTVALRWEITAAPDVADLEMIDATHQVKQALGPVGLLEFKNLTADTLFRLITGRRLFEFEVDRNILDKDAELRDAFRRAFDAQGMPLADDFTLTPAVPLPVSEDETWLVTTNGTIYYAKRDVRITIFRARVQEFTVAIQ